MDKEYHICFSSNEKYAGYVATLIQSIVDAFGENVTIPAHFHILETGDLKSETKDILNAFVVGFNYPSKLTFHTVSDEVLVFEKRKIKKWHGGGYAAYCRLLIPDLVGVEKALYLDADMVAMKDIRKVFEFDLRGKIAGVVRDWWQFNMLEREIKSLKGENSFQFKEKGEFYFNSGFFLFDCEKYKEAKVFDQCLYYLENFKAPNADQDALNYVLPQEKVLDMPLSFNWMKIALISKEKTDKMKEQNNFPADIVEKARKDIHIVHFAEFFQKPWLFYNKSPAHIKWYECAKKKHHFGKILKQGLKVIKKIL